ncbi:MAG TPA: hypothetical protein VM840_13625 [Actinomycetota bacterium]|nr:hypothetical protein [Actinomycetota bacterium]
MALAGAEELVHLVGTEVDQLRAERCLELVSAAIKGEAGNEVERRDGHEVRLRGTWRTELWLPNPPVLSVDVVEVDGQTLPEGGWEWRRSGLLLRSAPPLSNARPVWGWGGPRTEIRIVYSHGFDPVPGDLQAVCLQAAARLYANPGGVQAESIGSYSVTYPHSGGELLTAEERRVCRRYRQTA